MKKHMILAAAVAACAATLVLTACEKNRQNGLDNTPRKVFFTIVPDAIQAISPDANTIVAMAADGTLYTIDTRTDKRTDVCKFSGEEKIVAVSDNGIMVGNVGDESIGSEVGFYVRDGVKKTPSVPAGFSAEGVVVTGISADGSVMVGSASKNGGIVQPVRWDNGTPTAMPCPTDDRFGDDEVEVMGIMAEGVSPDGQIVVGRVNCNNSNQGLFWRDGRWEWMGLAVTKMVEPFPGEEPDMERTFVCHGRNVVFSSNGRYCGVSFGIWTQHFLGTMAEGDGPAVFDFTTETMSIVDDKGRGSVSFVSDSGAMAYRKHDFLQPEGYIRWPSEFFGAGGAGEQEAGKYVESLFNGIYIGPCVTISRLIEGRLVIGDFFNSATNLYIPFYARMD